MIRRDELSRVVAVGAIYIAVEWIAFVAYAALL